MEECKHRKCGKPAEVIYCSERFESTSELLTELKSRPTDWLAETLMGVLEDYADTVDGEWNLSESVLEFMLSVLRNHE